ncbi:MAG TPA: hypothetical protein VK961_15050, partial [Chthoniobacter sp.]|nr:hypothetical protein [Chthoniobacter sp.]
KVVPMTKDGVVIPDGQHLGSVCDKPPLLPLGSSAEAGQTVPYTRLGRIPTTTPNVMWVFIARRYKIRTEMDPLFEDVAIIGHNRVTGRTAFFQHLSDGTDATRVPSPMEPAAETPAGKIKAKDFWLSPQSTASINCFQCHDADVWIHTSFIDQVSFGGGVQFMVPPGPLGAAEEPPKPHPYSFIGSQFFTSWPNPMKHLKPANNECISCHRVGTEWRDTHLYLVATGRPVPGFPGLRISASAKTYPNSHSMPLNASQTMSQQEWDTHFKASVDQIISFKTDPSQAGANPTPVEPPPHP